MSKYIIILTPPQVGACRLQMPNLLLINQNENSNYEMLASIHEWSFEACITS